MGEVDLGALSWKVDALRMQELLCSVGRALGDAVAAGKVGTASEIGVFV